MSSPATDPLRPVTGSPHEVIEAVRGWLHAETEPESLVVETSGSTGAPKQVLLSRAAMLASAHATHERLGGAGQWLLALPPAYVAGLQVIVRSLAAEAEPVVVDDHPSLADAVAAMDAGRRYASLVPTQLHRMSDGDLAALATLDAVLLGGGPIDPDLRRRAADRGITIVATYGSSETSGGCVYDGRPLDGVRVEVDEDERIRIGGPTLFDGYQHDPELTAQVLVDGWFLTSDIGRIDDGLVQVLGRLDDVVISGGTNIPATAVARRLGRHVAIDDVQVLGVDDEEWGQRVVAFVVPAAGLDGALTLDALRDWVATEHPRTWAPRQLVVLDAIPLLENGKPDRGLLRALADRI
ncbi:AMP-binding protein [Nocardioides sp. AE5]|uniref:AMP-binding protein n=1 Tax=Nocardioides sp. AE5 TaxID=2962573 RepID=UPI002882B2D7|nr:AMP-binding protein [Nocardioides sp. AE5]MDT0200660.1 AMP-binding protein [Nocardioides sp. AE5]